MPRNFHRKRPMGVVAELNVTNMVDLGFSLLIVFMITAPLLHQEQTIPIDLPIESSRPQRQDRDEFQSVSIDRNGVYYWDDQRVTFQQVQLNLAAIAAQAKPPVLRIRADFTLQYQRV
ncbi:MAG TPA: biopolymer transporter ExbD, partial [Opitutaceae bacterium]|nr:biopolymer transporter ExbD [Opitutaceae bacterium]